MTQANESKRDRAITLQAEGKSAREISETLGVSKVSVYKYLQDNQAGAAAVSKSAPMTNSLDVELLRIELDATKRQLELYKRECSRLKEMLQE